VLNQLFADHVSMDEQAFADELYLSLGDVQRLVERGMDIAGHGDEHKRLALLDESSQRAEITGTQRLLESVYDQKIEAWTMCYPYGSRDATTLRLLEEAGCALGLTTDVGVADATSAPLELPRLDTNDLRAS
jgi:peptidoglycan/xylan/chitin deacetylase (PgdA/CDA1 family)